MLHRAREGDESEKRVLQAKRWALCAVARFPVHPLEEGVHVRRDREVVELVLRNVMAAFVQSPEDLGSALIRGEATEGSSVVHLDVELVMAGYRSALRVSHMEGLGEAESNHRASCYWMLARPDEGTLSRALVEPVCACH